MGSRWSQIAPRWGLGFRVWDLGGVKSHLVGVAQAHREPSHVGVDERGVAHAQVGENDQDIVAEDGGGGAVELSEKEDDALLGEAGVAQADLRARVWGLGFRV